MKTQIFYFSSTGNSLCVARDIAQAIGGEVELSAIPQALKSPVPVTASVIGIIFPVYIWGLPAIVRRFVEHLAIPPSTYVFSVATCDGNAAGTMVQLRELLEKRGHSLALGKIIRMPGNYILMYGAEPKWWQKRRFAKEKIAVQRIAPLIAARKPGKVDCGTWLGRLLLSKFVYNGGMKQIQATDIKFRSTEPCNGCGLCVKVCPVGNIVLKEGRPRWQHHCEHCLGCLQWCPREAIEFGKITEGRSRYHHPECSAPDFMF